MLARKILVLTVDVYTKPNCPPCKLTKKVLTDEGIEYRELPATEHVDYLVGLGYSGAPVVVANPTHHWAGFKPEAIRNLVQ